MGACKELGKQYPDSTPVAGECRVTNIYRRESGAWKIVHHHTDIAQAMINVLSQLQKKA